MFTKLPQAPTAPHAPTLLRVPKTILTTSKSAGEIRLDNVPFEQQYKPYPPFNSSYEVYIWDWLNKTGFQKIHQWQTQTTFGRKGAKGSTRVDFLSTVLMIAFYPDGTYWHVGNAKAALDPILRHQVSARGFRVVQWLLVSSDQLIRGLPDFYRDMVYRGRNH